MVRSNLISLFLRVLQWFNYVTWLNIASSKNELLDNDICLEGVVYSYDHTFFWKDK